MRRWLSLLLLILSITSCLKKTEPIERTPVSLEIGNYVKTHPVNVISIGFPGYTTQNLYKVKDTVIKAKPDLIIIMTGTNDVSQVQYDNYHKDLGTLVDSLRRGQNIDVMLLTPPVSTANGNNGFTLSIASLRSIIKDVCNEKKCMYVDTYTALRDKENTSPPLFFPDNTHPTAAGYTILANTVLKAYVDNKLSKYNIVCFGDSLTYGAMVTGAGTVTADTYPAQLFTLLN